MADEQSDDTSPGEPQFPEMSVAEFLEGHPPGSFVQVPDFHKKTGDTWIQNQPALQLFCASDECGGIRIFEVVEKSRMILEDHGVTDVFWIYRCRNCSRTTKKFALIGASVGGDSGLMFKFGEFPPFGPPVPPKVISLVGPDRELFLRGRRSESQGLGIGRSPTIGVLSKANGTGFWTRRSPSANGSALWMQPRLCDWPTRRSNSRRPSRW